MQKNIDRIAFHEDVRKAILPVFLGSIFAAVWIAFDLNVPVAQEILSGKALRSMAMASPKNDPRILTYIELDGGRTVAVQLPIGSTTPSEGERVIVIRYIKRFFGDSFGLK